MTCLIHAIPWGIMQEDTSETESSFDASCTPPAYGALPS